MRAADRPVFQSSQDLTNDYQVGNLKIQLVPNQVGGAYPPRAILLHPSQCRYTSRPGHASALRAVSTEYCMEYQEWSMRVPPLEPSWTPHLEPCNLRYPTFTSMRSNVRQQRGSQGGTYSTSSCCLTAKSNRSFYYTE